MKVQDFSINPVLWQSQNLVLYPNPAYSTHYFEILMEFYFTLNIKVMLETDEGLI